EAVSAGLIGNADALDRVASLRRLLAPPPELPQQRLAIRLQLLARIALQARNQCADKPSFAAHLDCRHQRAILIKGGEGTAEVFVFRLEGSPIGEFETPIFAPPPSPPSPNRIYVLNPLHRRERQLRCCRLALGDGGLRRGILELDRLDL